MADRLSLIFKRDPIFKTYFHHRRHPEFADCSQELAITTTDYFTLLLPEFQRENNQMDLNGDSNQCISYKLSRKFRPELF